MPLPRAEHANLVTPAGPLVTAVDISEPDVLQVFECDRVQHGGSRAAFESFDHKSGEVFDATDKWTADRDDVGVTNSNSALAVEVNFAFISLEP